MRSRGLMPSEGMRLAPMIQQQPEANAIWNGMQPVSLHHLVVFFHQSHAAISKAIAHCTVHITTLT